MRHPFNSIIKGLVFLFLLWSSVGFSVDSEAFDHSHQKFTEFLREYLTPVGAVRYKKLKADVHNNPKHGLSLYLNDLTLIMENQFNSWSKEQQMSFLINAYNAYTIRLIIDHYPVSSIRKIGGLFSSAWEKKFFKLLGGKIQTLDDIEHVFLRKKYKEPLIHSAVNCASISCPKLRSEAFVPEKLDIQLKSAFQEFLSDTSRNQFTLSGAKLSEIFKWYGSDFKEIYGDYKKAIIRFGPPESKVLNNLEIQAEWIQYNWELNDAKE